MDRINAFALKQRMDSGQLMTLLDVREPWEYEICHIDGSINIPMSQFLQRMEELEKNARIVVICHHGARSLQVAGFLEANGFDQVVNLEGGVSAWAAEVEPTMPVY